METMEIQLKQGNTDNNLVENHSTFDLNKRRSDGRVRKSLKRYRSLQVVCK